MSSDTARPLRHRDFSGADISSDPGGRRLADAVASLTALGEHDSVRNLLAPLDAEQLRDLVLTLATDTDAGTPTTATAPKVAAARDPSSPTSLCDLAISHAAASFDTTPEAILGADRHRTVTDARAVAMTAIRRSGLTLTTIASFFGKDHTSVIHAVRRTEDNPRLLAAAARIGQHIADHYACDSATGTDPGLGPTGDPTMPTGSRSHSAPRSEPPRLTGLGSGRGMGR